MIEVSAPGRCGIIGNPSDGYGGCLISSTLEERARVTIQADSRLRISICGHEAEIDSAADLEFAGDNVDVARAVLRFYQAELAGASFHLTGSTRIPFEAGLAGSTVMLMSILAAVQQFIRIEMTPYDLAETARRIEFDQLKIVCGFQDHYMAAFGGVNFVDFQGKEPGTNGKLVYAAVEPLAQHLRELPMVLGHTGQRRNSGSVHSSLRERWLAGDPAVVEGYRRAARLAREAKPLLLRGDWRGLGELMNENHAIQRDLGGSGEQNEQLIDAALRAGAFGAKLAGAGKGGTIIAVGDDLQRLSNALVEAGARNVLRVRPSDPLSVSGSLQIECTPFRRAENA